METLGRDGRVVIQGFGSFNLREYNARVSKKTVKICSTDKPVDPNFKAKPLLESDF